ncbi:hypothetical protein C1646_750996 [Rhizophagus diaphanus]|nr:hypothetical protein C1646_750996 [Rhizophagus diaphanus] [Rhizophagus sp. MUCL 43196]
MRRLTLNDAYAVVESQGGQCLSTQYTNNKDPLLWHCSNNHEWYAPLYRLKNHNKWCPTCGHDKRRLGILIAKEIALRNNGKCISDSYINNQTSLIWECDKSYQWQATLNSVKNNGSWCPYCSHINHNIFKGKRNLELAKKIALSKQGRYLSTEYINKDIPLLWALALHTIEDAKQIALNRNGQCLSTQYINNKSLLLWCCSNKHKWYSNFTSIANENTWCPYCDRFKHENLCRKVITKYLGPPSANRWPDFLKTSEHPRGLELDIPYYYYSFAIEVQGIQHEKYHEFFHRGDPMEFTKQQERDQLKKKLCDKNHILLKYIWYHEDPFKKILEILQELGLIS